MNVDKKKTEWIPTAQRFAAGSNIKAELLDISTLLIFPLADVTLL